MRKLTPILLMITILLQTFSALVVVSGYEANKSFISAYLCENKSKPTLHCNGKCFLMKALKKEADNEEKANNSFRERFEVNQFVQRVSEDFIDTSYIELSQTSFFIQKKDPSKIPLTVFHPPQV